MASVVASGGGVPGNRIFFIWPMAPVPEPGAGIDCTKSVLTGRKPLLFSTGAKFWQVRSLTHFQLYKSEGPFNEISLKFSTQK